MATYISINKENQSSVPSSLCSLTFDTATVIDVPQATTKVQMERGLSKLSDVGSGMLFTWPDDELRVFWMRETLEPLSVAFISMDGTILQMENMHPETETLHWSRVPVREALEMKAGDFEKLSITVGSRIISRNCKAMKINNHQ